MRLDSSSFARPVAALLVLGLALMPGCGKDDASDKPQTTAEADKPPPVELDEVPVPEPPPADGEFLRAVRPVVERVCLCKDLACATEEMNKLRELQPSVPELEEAGRLAERMQRCVKRLAPSRSNTPSFAPDDDEAPPEPEDELGGEDDDDKSADETGGDAKGDGEKGDGSDGDEKGADEDDSDGKGDEAGDDAAGAADKSGTDEAAAAEKPAEPATPKSYTERMTAAVDAVCACKTLECAATAMKATNDLEPSDAELAVAVREGKRMRQCMARLADAP